MDIERRKPNVASAIMLGLLILLFGWIGGNAACRAVNKLDAKHVAYEKDKIQRCKDIGGHPVLYWHTAYGEWFLESCKL